MKRLPRMSGCPVELSLVVLGGKWKPVILARLKDRPLRYADLRKLIPALSDKVLTERLRDLEESGLIERLKDSDSVRYVTYRLTGRGQSLRGVLQALYDWGEAAAPELGVTIRPD